MTTLLFKKLHREAALPRYATDGSVGLDLSAFLISEEGRLQKLMLPPRTVRPCRTGLSFEIKSELPPSCYAQVVSRSGMVAKQCISVANAPGIIDLDYRGEIMVLLYNGGLEVQWIQHGDRIAQMLLAPFYPAEIKETVQPLSVTSRGSGGFGSTGR